MADAEEVLINRLKAADAWIDVKEKDKKLFDNFKKLKPKDEYEILSGNLKNPNTNPTFEPNGRIEKVSGAKLREEIIITTALGALNNNKDLAKDAEFMKSLRKLVYGNEAGAQGDKEILQRGRKKTELAINHIAGYRAKLLLSDQKAQSLDPLPPLDALDLLESDSSEKKGSQPPLGSLNLPLNSLGLAFKIPNEGEPLQVFASLPPRPKEEKKPGSKAKPATII